MNNTQPTTITECLSISYFEHRGDDGDWEIEARFQGHQLALAVDRHRERALARVKAEVASQLDSLASSLRAEARATP